MSAQDALSQADARRGDELSRAAAKAAAARLCIGVSAAAGRDRSRLLAGAVSAWNSFALSAAAQGSVSMMASDLEGQAKASRQLASEWERERGKLGRSLTDERARTVDAVGQRCMDALWACAVVGQRRSCGAAVNALWANAVRGLVVDAEKAGVAKVGQAMGYVAANTI